MANFEAYHWVISSSINLLFLKGVLRAYCMQCIYIRPQTPNILPKGGQKYYKIGQKMQDCFLWKFSENVSKVIIGMWGKKFSLLCEFWIYKFMTFGLFKILIYTYLYTLLLFLLLEMFKKYFVFLIFFCSFFFIFKNLS